MWVFGWAVSEVAGAVRESGGKSRERSGEWGGAGGWSVGLLVGVLVGLAIWWAVGQGSRQAGLWPGCPAVGHIGRRAYGRVVQRSGI